MTVLTAAVREKRRLVRSLDLVALLLAIEPTAARIAKIIIPMTTSLIMRLVDRPRDLTLTGRFDLAISLRYSRLFMCLLYHTIYG